MIEKNYVSYIRGGDEGGGWGWGACKVICIKRQLYKKIQT